MHEIDNTYYVQLSGNAIHNFSNDRWDAWNSAQNDCGAWIYKQCYLAICLPFKGSKQNKKQKQKSFRALNLGRVYLMKSIYILDMNGLIKFSMMWC